MKPDTVQPGYYRPPQAAAYIGLSERHLRALTRRGALPVFRLGRRCALYSKSDLDKALKRFRVSAVGE